ncbi:cytochrome P450 [Streptomyces sp. NPDC001404]|uniref:cytochrome P450 n=1 Tax=Streptomyces sp. NPDC001404 TaxID=3364571 RepID=UPI0036A115A8
MFDKPNLMAPSYLRNLGETEMTETKTAWRVTTAAGLMPFFGHLLQLRKGLLHFMESLPAQGDLVQIQFGPWKAHVVCDSALVDQMLRNDRTFDKGGPMFEKLRSVAGNGLVTCPYRDHRRQRRLLQPLFHRDRLPAYAQVMSEQITAVLDTWQDGQSIPVSAEMHRLAARVVARTLFTGDPNTPEDPATRAAQVVEASLGAIMRGTYRHMVTPVAALQHLPTPGNRRYQRARADIRAAVRRTLTEYRRRDSDHGDMLSALVTARDVDGRPLDDAEIHDQITTMLIAGIESTANGLTWALYTLASNPVLQDRLQDEADTVLGGRIATWDDLPRLDLASRIIYETLRMYAPVWCLTRATSTSTELAGHPLPSGSTLIYSPYLIHHQPAHYPDPKRFDPDRWLPGPLAQRPRHAYIPFAAGARKCIGDTFSLIDSTLTLASIAARWHIQPPNAPPSPAARITLAPKRLDLRMQLRIAGVCKGVSD